MNAKGTHYRAAAETAWRWILAQVRWDDEGPRIPASVPGPELDPAHRNGFHMGIGGLAYVLAEIGHCREWTAEEKELSSGIAGCLAGRTATETAYDFFAGLVSDIGVLTALDAPGTAAVVRRLTALATPTGWSQTFYAPPRFPADARLNDVTLGTAGVLLGAVWAHRNGVAAARELATAAADVLVAEADLLPTGVNWLFMPLRHQTEPRHEMPNFSHGLAGIATALALAGVEFHRPDLVDLAVRGAEHLVSLGTTDGETLLVPHYLTDEDMDADEFTHNWCHGGAGTSLLFVALHLAGVEKVAGAAPLVWQHRCLHGVRTSGLPARLHPGFWDNDGRCCGTAGVAEVFLDSWQRDGHPDDLDFAVRLADTLLARAVVDGPYTYWRFTEHRAEEPLLPPGVGWAQGAAGIAAFLFRASRVAAEGRAAAVAPRLDSWWATAVRGTFTTPTGPAVRGTFPTPTAVRGTFTTPASG